MAYDKKMLRTCKCLEKLCKPPKYINRGKSYYNERIRKVNVRFGRFYATNDYALVCVEWPEYEHAGDECWMTLHEYTDGEGNLLIPFVCKEMEQPFSDNKIFERCFIERCDYSEPLPVNPRLMRDVLEIFQVNGLSPVIVHDGARYELLAHSKDVSIKAVVMGEMK